MARDWPADLWDTSFKGVPFWVRRAKSPFGRRLQIDEFPEQDDPFIQDLGGAYRTDQVEAYLVGDTSDTDAEAFVAMLLSAGSGTLVLPEQGPTVGWFRTGERAYDLDRQGFIAFSLTFVREGTSPAPELSTDYLAQLTFDASGALLGALSALTDAVVLA